MKDEDFGLMKVVVSPDRSTVALKLDARGLRILTEMASKAVPARDESPVAFRYRHDAVSGALLAARLLMDGGK